MLSLLLFSLPALAWSDPTNPFGLGPLGYVTNASLGPQLELWHEFYGQWPTGVAVSASGRLFANFPVQNVINFTVGELNTPTTEVPFPSLEMNTPDSLFNSTNPLFGSGYTEKLISVQSVVIDPKDRLWILDTGRPSVNGVSLLASEGGPKLIGVDLTTNQTFQTITFPTWVAYPDTYLNDVRFDLRPSITPSGQGVAYIADSSDEGRNGVIVVDLGTGTSWRHLDRAASVTADPGFLSGYDGVPFTPIHPPTVPFYPGTTLHFTTGVDGIALSADGEWFYFSPLASRRFYRIATELLRVQPGPLNPTAQDAAVAGVQYLGQHASHADGMETSNDGTIYMGAPEHDSVFAYYPSQGRWEPFVHDPKIQWPDSLSVGVDGYLYFTVNQYTRQPGINNGTDSRIKPYGVFRAQLPNAAAKVTELR
ncbi:MRJP-domain-containing protein [Dacryopinax primogenitus]|uniref:MRJP-domain-containing protein n=1 Tax=Dacryopinax primogenitus (strain DJM 731) TaxID=1858805 RepID=M5G0K3_DACPD|nr:MRJP-domain-containing protein [Dacryopinax primogenitus]EJU02269.1 MRJP-domain-containing protein [Dacryopinax primogenitus]